MKRLVFSALPVFSVVLLLGLGTTAVHAGAKVKVCHLPPGNPANFHTISISEKSLGAHLAHGDLAGGCYAYAEELCDDGDACTIDAMDEQTETCLPDHPQVDCDDGSLCTIESCDPAIGCQYAPVVCDDGDPCTVDECSQFDGQCTGTPIYCGALGLCLPETGKCDFPCDGITCDPIDQCHEAGECVLPGDCIDGLPVTDGTPCDDGDAGTTDDQCTNGVCAGTPAAVCGDGVLDPEEECDDGDACTKDACENNVCKYVPIQGCCNTSSDCHNENPCSVGCCTSNNTCRHSLVSGCCTADSQCSDGSSCTTDTCDLVSLTCEHTPIPGCCENDVDCLDNNPCTNDSCSGSQCLHTAVPGCCLTNGDCYGGDSCNGAWCNTSTHTCEHL